MKTININDLIEIILIFAVPNSKITEDTKLLEQEVIDSLNVMQIISEIEAQYSLSIGAMDLSFGDFESPSILKQALDKL